ncbi:MAG: hypothetical protein AB8B72_02205 [Crocinitomicaceae bacterium]
MDKFLLNIEKYKYAILGTILVHLLVIVGSSFSQVQKISRKAPEAVSVEIPLDNIEIPDDEIQTTDENQDEASNENLSNVAADANDTRDKAFENYSTNKEEVEQDVMLNAKELERQFFEEAAANNPNNKVDKRERTEIETKADKLKMPGENDASTSGGDKAFAGKVMISFDLVGRKAFSLPNPGYTCKNSGTIVVEIKVASDGTVKGTRYIGSQSSSNSECLVQRALKYAARARFNSGSAGSQTGTITYKFVSQ